MSTDQQEGDNKNTTLPQQQPQQPPNSNNNTSNNDIDEKKNDDNNLNDKDKVSIKLEIDRCQFFVIKQDQRKELASGKLCIITDEPDHNELVFTFPDYNGINHTLSSLDKRPTIKICDSDYIFVDPIDSFGLYIDDNNLKQFEELISLYSYFKISSKIHPIHKYPINNDLTVGPPDKIALAGIKLAKLICTTSVITAKTIRKATLYSTNSINKSTRYLKTKIKPNDQPTKISPKIQNGLAKAQLGSKAVVKVSGAVLSGCIATANVLSNEMTDVVAASSVGKKLSSSSGAKTKAAKEIVKSTVAGAYTIYDELVTSGLHLVTSSSSSTADLLGHKYGSEVHRLAQTSADIVDSAAHTVVNINMLGYKSLAKRIAANSTIDVLSNENERKQNQNERLNIDPINAAKVLLIANNIDNKRKENKKQIKEKRQNYVGIVPVDQSIDNYKMHNDIPPAPSVPSVPSAPPQSQIDNVPDDYNINLQNDLSVSSMSGINSDLSNNINVNDNDNNDNNDNSFMYDDETLEVD